MGLSTAFVSVLYASRRFCALPECSTDLYEATNAAAMRVMPREWISDPASAVAKAEAQ